MTRQATQSETERKKEREKIKRETEKERERKRESASTAERGETHMGTKREVKKPCRSVPSL